MGLIQESDMLDIRGARNFEMMQGINKDSFFGFMVCREFSEATIGLPAKDTPLIYMRQPAGERSFSDFRQRRVRTTRGRKICPSCAKDNQEKWEGGHWAKYADWSDKKRTI